MLELKKIKREYVLNNFKQTALNGVSLKFRDSEFVSILGPSGSGKTTLLNIIGGLDTYDSGDLVINGVSTKKYNDADWDTYRNHNVGFVFQSYNLISHQTILANVELALTISGVDAKTRCERAVEILDRVGLKDHIYKKPNQLSGGQMQRVAIARALVNNPDILLADEPTGALDSETSVQIMELLKEIAETKLVIMVTHNPELAEEYSTRIVKVLDGNILSDSKEYDGKYDKKGEEVDSKGKHFMTFKTALDLSYNNLLTKKGRTLMTAFAGSIGIIGIAVILSLSNGVQEYIKRVEEDTLSGYPISITEQSVDPSSIIMGMGEQANKDKDKEEDYIYSNDMVMQMMNMVTSQIQSNNLSAFKDFVENGDSDIDVYLNAINYSYNLNLQLYKNVEGEVVQVNPNYLFEDVMAQSPMMSSSNVFFEMIDNEELFKTQYELLAGDFPTSYSDVLIVVDDNNEISDFTLYTLGLKDQTEIETLMGRIMAGEVIEEPEAEKYTYDELLDVSFKLVLSTDYYQKSGNVWLDMRNDQSYMLELLEDALEINVVGIVRSAPESNISSVATGGIYYSKDLTTYVIEKTNLSSIAVEQMENTEVNVLTGLEFTDEEFDVSNLSKEEKEYLSTLSDEELAIVMQSYTNNSAVTYDSILESLGVVNLDDPSVINLYPKDFDSKAAIEEIINNYNDAQTEAGLEENVISYTDMVGLMMSSITTIIDLITYVLVAFVSISLIVSSIMIGIITYISVLERTKEIGILRAIGASKKDISTVFNAETFIIGLFSGVLGIAVTIIINVIANVVIKSMLDISNLVSLPLMGGVILILISVILTMFAGLVPSKMASKKNPVEALRTE